MLTCWDAFFVDVLHLKGEQDEAGDPFWLYNSVTLWGPGNLGRNMACVHNHSFNMVDKALG